jgi:hypothetical protein
MRRRTILSTLLAIAAVIGLVVVGTSDTASSHDQLRAHLDATLVAPSGVAVGDDLVSYVGTFEFHAAVQVFVHEPITSAAPSGQIPYTRRAVPSNIAARSSGE